MSADADEMHAKSSYAQTLIKNSQKTIIVKPKGENQKNQSIAKTKSDVLKNVDPLTDINIGKVKNLKDGGVLLQCDSSSNFKQSAMNNLSDQYDIREVKTIGPRVRITGIPDYIKEEDIALYMRKQNESIFDEKSICTLLKYGPVKKNNTIFQAVFEVDLLTYKRALALGHCLVGLNGCTIYDAIDVSRCFNCNSYGHSHKFCKNSSYCPRCAHRHNLKECQADVEAFKCVNCYNFNFKNNNHDVNINHAAWDHDKCHSYKMVIQKVKQDLFGLSI
ncbi:hypothetical protein Zmor_005015 [Zophobas morio]|uniref:CCHC-type domain-containing protein n=1 Tax=Zophobas morio TaxID=2755281 RepID=A0AA38MLG1_9CUCU|nr:hypothetical protein Zmor_004553 [Zophobas morio]KAJ3660573.1 hypothetical protein Zmor_005015 [Zophobas morio]